MLNIKTRGYKNRGGGIFTFFVQNLQQTMVLSKRSPMDKPFTENNPWVEYYL